MPSTAPASTSVILSPPALKITDAIVLPVGLASFLVTAVRSILPVLSSAGAVLVALTVIFAVSVAVLNAVIPPFVVVSTVVPAAPEVLSHARKVMPLDTVPV